MVVGVVGQGVSDVVGQMKGLLHRLIKQIKRSFCFLNYSIDDYIQSFRF